MTEAQQAAIIGNAAFETAPVEWQEDGVIFMQTEDDVGPVDAESDEWTAEDFKKAKTFRETTDDEEQIPF